MSWVVTLEYRIKGGGSVVGCYPRIPNKRRGQCRGSLPSVCDRKSGSSRSGHFFQIRFRPNTDLIDRIWLSPEKMLFLIWM